MRRLARIPVLFLLTACPVEHAGVDSSDPPNLRDGGATDALVIDAHGSDAAAGQDVVAGPDRTGPDAAAHDASMGADRAGLDSSAGTDTAGWQDAALGQDTAADHDAAAALDSGPASDADGTDVSTSNDAAAGTDAGLPDEAGDLLDPRPIGLPLSDFVLNIDPVGDVDCFQFTAASELWIHAWATDAAGTCASSVMTSDFDTRLAVYAAGETDPGNHLAFDDDSGPNYCPDLSFIARAGQGYVVCVDGYPYASQRVATYFDIHLSITSQPPPADAQGDLGAPLSVAPPVTSAATLAGDTDLDCFAFSVPAAHVVVTQLGGSGASTVEQRLYAAGATDPAQSLEVRRSSTQEIWSVAAGDYVMCLVSTSGSQLLGGLSYHIELLSIPGNATCQGAETLVLPENGDVVLRTGNSLGALDTRSSTGTCQSGDGAAEVFYTFTTSASMQGHVLAESATDGSWWPALYAFQDSCQATTDLACGDGLMTFAVQPSTTYYLVVDGDWSGDDGVFDLSVRYVAIASHTTCAAPRILDLPADGSMIENAAITAGDHNERDSSLASQCQATAHYAPEHFYQIDVGASPVTLHVELETPGWDGVLYLFEGGCSSSSDLLCKGQSSSVLEPLWFRQELAAATSYRLVVDGYGDILNGDASGPYFLRTRRYLPSPALQGGDTCVDAPALSGAQGSLHDTTAVAGRTNWVSPSAVGCSSDGSGADTVYRLTVPAGHTADLRLAGSAQGMNTLLYVLRDDCPVRANSCVDEATLHWQPEASLSFSNASGSSADYFVVVDYKYSGVRDWDLFWDVHP